MEHFSILTLIITVIISGVGCYILIRIGKNKERSNKLIYALSQIQYLLLQTIVIATYITISTSIKINQLILYLILIVVLFLVDKLINRKLLINTSEKIKVALCFFAMLLCIMFFFGQAVLEHDYNTYKGVLSNGVALVIGFFLPLDVILEDTYLKKKFEIIVEGTGEKKLGRTVKILYALVAVIFFAVMYSAKNNLAIKYYISVCLGLVFGFVFVLIIQRLFFERIYNVFDDCTDIRKEIFEHSKFKEYKTNLEKNFNLKSGAPYDQVEAFLFYKAFVLKEPELCSKLINNDILSEEEKTLVISKDKYGTYYNEKEKNTPIDSKKEVVYDGLVDGWEIFENHIKCYSELFQKNQNDNEKNGNDVGYNSEEERWLFYFLEYYHPLSKKEKKKIIPTELNIFFATIFKEQSLWIIPEKCKQYFAENKEKNAIEEVEIGGIILSSAYDWFECKATGKDSKKCLSDKGFDDSIIETIESWLSEYEDWSSFIISNNLRRIVDRKRSLNSYGFKQPKTFKLYDKTCVDINKRKKKYLKSIKEMTDNLNTRCIIDYSYITKKEID